MFGWLKKLFSEKNNKNSVTNPSVILPSSNPVTGERIVHFIGGRYYKMNSIVRLGK